MAMIKSDKAVLVADLFGVYNELLMILCKMRVKGHLELDP